MVITIYKQSTENGFIVAGTNRKPELHVSYMFPGLSPVTHSHYKKLMKPKKQKTKEKKCLT